MRDVFSFRQNLRQISRSQDVPKRRRSEESRRMTENGGKCSIYLNQHQHLNQHQNLHESTAFKIEASHFHSLE